MDSKDLNKSLLRAMEKALESLAFVEAIPLNEDTPPLPDELKPKPRTRVLWTFVEIVRPISGNVYLLMPPELGKSLTMDMFGLFDDSEVTDEMVIDAMGELNNVLSGRVADEILGENAEFELGLPKHGIAEQESEVTLPPGKTHKLDYAVEGFTLSVILGGKDFQ
jgi:CheY-specific phosphatase CheX